VAKEVDEMLMAFVDGELGADERKRVEEALSSNPELRERLKVFEATREPIARAFDSLMPLPASDDLVKLIRGEEQARGGARDQAAAGQEPSVISQMFGRIFHLNWGLVFALFAMFLVGTSTGWLIDSQMFSDRSQMNTLLTYQDDNLLARGSLARALETVRSGKKLMQDDRDGQGVSIKPVVTFRDHQHRFCREYEVVYPLDRQFSGLACRANERTWQVLVHVPIAPHQAAQNDFAPASGEDTQLLDAVVERMMAGEALAAENESALIERNWQAD